MAAGHAHRELGRLDGPLLLFGGPYSNHQATRALIGMARRMGVRPEHAICTGDVVAYCADPQACLREIRAFGCVVVAGNCERQLAAGADDCGCGFEPGTRCDLLSAGWYGYAAGSVAADDRAWMRDCPDIVTFTHDGRRHAVIHGGLSDISRFLWPGSAEEDFAEEIACIAAVVGPVDTVVAGHCGVAFARRVGVVDWINAGAIGLPPHDGRPETRCVVLSGGRAMIHRLSYDWQAARAAMQAAGLTKGYERALRTGIWPAEDVLPPELRRA